MIFTGSHGLCVLFKSVYGEGVGVLWPQNGIVKGKGFCILFVCLLCFCFGVLFVCLFVLGFGGGGGDFCSVLFVCLFF